MVQLVLNLLRSGGRQISKLEFATVDRLPDHWDQRCGNVLTDTLVVTAVQDEQKIEDNLMLKR